MYKKYEIYLNQSEFAIDDLGRVVLDTKFLGEINAAAGILSMFGAGFDADGVCPVTNYGCSNGGCPNRCNTNPRCEVNRDCPVCKCASL